MMRKAQSQVGGPLHYLFVPPLIPLISERKLQDQSPEDNLLVESLSRLASISAFLGILPWSSPYSDALSDLVDK